MWKELALSYPRANILATDSLLARAQEAEVAAKSPKDAKEGRAVIAAGSRATAGTVC
jgi:hypothetical protein